MDIKEFFIRQRESSRPRTLQVVAMVPPGQLGWRPASGALSFGETLRHIWHSEESLRKLALEHDFSYYRKRIPQGLRSVIGSHGTLAEELANLTRVNGETLIAARALPIERWDDECLDEEMGFRRSVADILLSTNAHEIHHRAQLMTYLRILGTPVPESIALR